eukprot:Gb_05768 [translate_table: standard]
MAEQHGSPESSPGSDNEYAASQDSSLREQDRFLPIANVGRIMKRALPANGKISKDAKETVQECVSEFISFITGEASDKCQREKRKTINGDDLLWAMSTLGFEEYIEPLKLYLHKYRELEGEKVTLAKQGGGGVAAPDQSAPSKDANGGVINGHINGPARGLPQHQPQQHSHIMYGQGAYQMPYQMPAGGSGSSGGFGNR